MVCLFIYIFAKMYILQLTIWWHSSSSEGPQQERAVHGPVMHPNAAAASEQRLL